MAKRSAKSSEDKAAPAKSAAPPYQVFARRFRPQSFSDVAGQTAVISALKQALSTGRVAQAYMFCGPRGVGKTSLARIVAKALNCLRGKGPGGTAEEPCNECEACVSIQEGSAMDVVEMDAATNRGIEEVRELRDRVGIAPAELRYKVYIIDEVHMLTREAWNAFLKTLEEPPAHVKFVFATTDPNNVPETILSRCQRYDLKRISLADIVKRLRQICELDKIKVEEAALSRIASLARGGLRDAEGLLDQAVNLGGGNVTDEVVRNLSGAAPDETMFAILQDCAAGKTAAALTKTHECIEAGADPDDLLEVLIERLRGMLLFKVCGDATPLLEGQAHLKTAYTDLSAKLSEDQALMLIQLFSGARRQMRDATQTRLPLELALVRASRASELVDLGKLVSSLEHGRGPQAGMPAPPAREGPRPNSTGRPADTVSRPAALNEQKAEGGRQTAGVTPQKPPTPANWDSVLKAAQEQREIPLLSGALACASSNLDLKSARLTLAFKKENELHRRALEKENAQTVLKDILARVFKKTISIVISASEGGAQVSQDRGSEYSESGEEIETEFVEEGVLPLPPAPSVEPEVENNGENWRGAVPPPVPAPTPPRQEVPVSMDVRVVADHPVIKAVLKETGGYVVDVKRTRKDT